MTVFRYKRNGMLYLLARVSPSKVTGSWMEAVPFNHTQTIGLRGGNKFKSNMSIEDFEAVSIK